MTFFRSFHNATRLGLFAATLTLPAFAQYSAPVRDVENPARTAVQFQFSCTGTFGVKACSRPTVPAGMRLVIETVAYRVESPTACSPLLRFDLKLNSLFYIVHLEVPRIDASSNRYLKAHKIRLYADDMDEIFEEGCPNSTGSSGFISGYLVKM